MKCPNCENKKYKKLRKFYLESVIAYWCTQCGTIYGPTHDYGKVIPNLSRWRKFKDEPPPLMGSNIKDYMDIQAASKGMEPGEFYIDMAGYNIHSGEYKRDYYNGTKIEWWRPIGPLPKTEES